MVTYYAKVDIRSNNRKIPPYALKGAKLTKIGTDAYSDVWPMQGRDGNMFPAHKDKLSTEFVKPDLTPLEIRLFERLILVLKRSETEYISLFNSVRTDKITKFDIAENKKMWLDIAEMVYTEITHNNIYICLK